MSDFRCQVCGAAFEVSPAALAKFPGWQPKYCREHSPAKAKRARRSKASTAREENLTVAEVLAKYHDGPTSGVFCDGSSVPNPGPGGWGFVWVENGEIRAQDHGRDPDTTNNRMELTALIEAYRALPKDAETIVYSDSNLCVQTINQWAPNWERKGWKKKSGPIKNLELVQQLLALHRAHAGCQIAWIAAHSGNRWNEYADSLATSWLRDEL